MLALGIAASLLLPRRGLGLDLERRDVSLARGELRVRDAKTEAGIRTVDLTPALRDELALWLDRSPFKRPTDPVFPTGKGTRDNRHGVRERVVKKAIELANPKLAELSIDPIRKVTPHGLRRTYASLRCAVGDDVAFTSAQLGHEDALFSLRTYTHAVKRREKLIGAVRAEFEKAVEWAKWGDDTAAMGTSAQTNGAGVAPVENATGPDAATQAEPI